jgi:molybdenum cofactor synthesis domain-containing protein
VPAHHHLDHDTGAPLVPFEEARAAMLGGIEALRPRALSLGEALGCVLAEPVASPIDLPPFTSSAMDGFAVRAADVANASPERPVALGISGRVEMGRPADVAVERGGAVAVPTGGVVPEGADAVVPIERCAVRGDRVLVGEAVPEGRFVRPAGQDVRAGDELLGAGRRLAPGDIGLLASAGVAEVRAVPRARVAVVSTGDELVAAGRPLGPGRIHDANGALLRAAVEEAGAVIGSVQRVGDDPIALARALEAAAAAADLLVSSGGVSVGEGDPVKGALGSSREVRFLDVAMQPGKPQAFGRVSGVPYFGLPGNPVSVFVSFEVFVRPALMRLMGRDDRRPEIEATLDDDLTGPANKTMFARVLVRRDGDRWRASSTGPRQSNLIATVSRANGLAVIPARVETLRAGERARVILFRDPKQP